MVKVVERGLQMVLQAGEERETTTPTVAVSDMAAVVDHIKVPEEMGAMIGNILTKLNLEADLGA